MGLWMQSLQKNRTILDIIQFQVTDEKYPRWQCIYNEGEIRVKANIMMEVQWAKNLGKSCLMINKIYKPMLPWKMHIVIKIGKSQPA